MLVLIGIVFTLVDRKTHIEFQVNISKVKLLNDYHHVFPQNTLTYDHADHLENSINAFLY